MLLSQLEGGFKGTVHRKVRNMSDKIVYSDQPKLGVGNVYCSKKAVLINTMRAHEALPLKSCACLAKTDMH